jgi:hypothetical protein
LFSKMDVQQEVAASRAVGPGTLTCRAQRLAGMLHKVREGLSGGRNMGGGGGRLYKTMAVVCYPRGGGDWGKT